MGEGTGASHVPLRAGASNEEEATGWAESADTAASAGAGGPGEEHDDPARQEEGVHHPQAARARTVSGSGPLTQRGPGRLRLPNPSFVFEVTPVHEVPQSKFCTHFLPPQYELHFQPIWIILPTLIMTSLPIYSRILVLLELWNRFGVTIPTVSKQHSSHIAQSVHWVIQIRVSAGEKTPPFATTVSRRLSGWVPGPSSQW